MSALRLKSASYPTDFPAFHDMLPVQKANVQIRAHNSRVTSPP
jgi:hypothetical protein